MNTDDFNVPTSTPEFLARQKRTWTQSRVPTPEKMEAARLVLEDIQAGMRVFEAIKRHPLKTPGGGFVGKAFVIAAYREMVSAGELDPDPRLMEKIRMKPMRTLSGVTTVTVLTKPYPCPGKCIFCPTDVRMPKSYLADEPGAMRALHNEFDPYDQVQSRLEALHAIGHPTEKIELLILGGTWSSYRKDYQEWFILRCFEALNGEPTDTPVAGPGEDAEMRREKLLTAQAYNETAQHRSVGLVVETRPDHVDPAELAWLRYLGVTKVQMGALSLDDGVLALNRRGHTAAETLAAAARLRAAGFKIVLHWMPNLLGATPDSDRVDFTRLWEGYCPDEIKIYPTQLLANAELFAYWERGEFEPYATEVLVDLIADIKLTIPRYCRVNRVVRDIPSTNVVAGNKRTSLRMDVHRLLAERGARCQCVRCREIRGQTLSAGELTFEDLTYQAAEAEEHFLSYNTPEDQLAGFLRLSLPGENAPAVNLADLEGAAIIREVHVYGQSLAVGAVKAGAAQHIGLGTRLLEDAQGIARAHGFQRLAVIAAVGTRRYYEDRGFQRGELYLVKDIS